MTTEWFETVRAELLAQNPFRGSEYFKRFAAGSLTREQAWGHVSQWFFLICWFPRMFSGIHSRCDELDVRKDCARHLLVEKSAQVTPFGSDHRAPADGGVGD
jgi:pyrroloquinoline quinone (PQQ) biosynthesis protein C